MMTLLRNKWIISGFMTLITLLFVGGILPRMMSGDNYSMIMGVLYSSVLLYWDVKIVRHFWLK